MTKLFLLQNNSYYKTPVYLPRKHINKLFSAYENLQVLTLFRVLF